VTGALSKKDEDLNAYRKQCLDLEKQLKVKDDKISELQTQIITLSNDISDKDMALDFYASSEQEM